MEVDQEINPKKILGEINTITKTPTEYLIEYETGEQAKVNILNNHVFKYFMSPTGKFPDYPQPINPGDVAKITVKKVSDYDLSAFEKSHLKEHDKSFVINTNKIHIQFDKTSGKMSVYDKRTNKVVFSEAKPLSYSQGKSTQKLVQYKDEYFFGGGMQNGRFCHKGEVIHIENTNNWIDGGVTSPNPFYWSTYGYGVLRHTWQPGRYDFGVHKPDQIKTMHKGGDFDAFFFINPLPKDILADYFELTGKPLLMPEYAFYEAHLNAFNRDYWVKVAPGTPRAILFEDGCYYKSYKPDEIGDRHGILESLNGEKDNYQFSARAMVDRYKKHDVPLGWFIPNDGYGSGYGQTDSLDGDIENLRQFAEYARDNGVEVALWTESQLEPKDPANPQKGERDLAKEVGVAGVVALKCDVAWIGAGYSFGLNAVDNATKIFMKTTTHRPLIIMVDGWGGTQRYSGIWSGDQTGGQWEYIRFHIPTYIGSGLSGQPIVGSDMDGIYGGKSRDVNIRDYQWKTFTPLQLNMDGWGNIPKTPFTFDKEATLIIRAYLKMKSMMLPYNYTIGHESIHGLPMIRAMFLEYPNEIPAHTLDSQYQFMWGPSILVAPIYQQKGSIDGSMRDGIYLPDPNQVWFDLFTGERYQGGKIWNNIKAPLWKIPIFVKDGAIIPMVNPNNNPYEIQRNNRIFLIYPNGETKFEVYEDDGISVDYLKKQSASTEIKVHGPKSNQKGDLFINIHKTKGYYKGMIKERTTVLRIMTSEDVQHIKAAVNGEHIKLTKVLTQKDFDNGENVFFFTKDYTINPFLNDVPSIGEIWKLKFLLIKIAPIDVCENDVHLKIKDYTNQGKVFGSNTNLNHLLETPSNLTALTVKTSITLLWQPVQDATYYEIERDGTVFTNIIGASFTFVDIKRNSDHVFRVRSVNDEGVSQWSDFVDADKRFTNSLMEI
ncbi:glycosyl hydrolases family 31 domain-containing protein [Phthorimaea operculella]|nr:glycosyl hydrolases family 31 domain-containing protein [Phthorimaea operculella]